MAGESTPGESTPGESTPGESTPGASTPGGTMPGNFMQQALDNAAATAPDWLRDWLQDGRDRWAASTLPTRKTEAWKYTSIRALQQDYAVPGAAAAASAPVAMDIPQLGGCRLVFVNGYLRADLSSDRLPDGVSVVRFADADEQQASRIRQHLGSAAGRERGLFGALNDASLADGVFLDVAADARVEETLQLAWVTSSTERACSVNQRLLVLCGTGSELRLIEHFASDTSEQFTFTNGVTELLLQPGARLEHYRLHLEETLAMHVGGVYARLDRDATLEGFHLALGSVLKRVDIVVEHRGPGAHCGLAGVYLPREKEHVDYHTCVEHAVPHCTTDEVFRGIVADEARAVFNGRIHIHPDAQKTRAELSNRNLLTSAHAEVDTKPELEIYADDVQCAHGATVAQLDDTSLHYLRTRGIAEDEARVMLSFGFINEVIDTIRCERVRDYLRPLLARRLARDPSLTRHLA
jgi:Fe-S cluster assembly protein SufD